MSEIALPLTFASAGLIVFDLLALATIVGFATVRCVTQQTAEIACSVDSAMDEAATGLDVDPASLGDASVNGTVAAGLGSL